MSEPVADHSSTARSELEDDFCFFNMEEADEPTRREVPAAAESFTAVQLEPGWLDGEVNCLVADGQGEHAELRMLHHRANMHFFRGEYVKTEACAREAMTEFRLNKIYAKSFRELLVLSLHKQGRYEDAVAPSRERTTADTGYDTNGHRLLAISLHGAGLHAEAVEYYHRVLTVQRSNAGTWLALGKAYLAMGASPVTSPLYAASALIRAHSWALGMRRSAQGWTAGAPEKLQREIEGVLATVPMVAAEADWGAEGLARVQAALFALGHDGCCASREAVQTHGESCDGLKRALAAYDKPAMSVVLEDSVWGADFERFWFVYCPRLPVDEVDGEETEEVFGDGRNKR